MHPMRKLCSPALLLLILSVVLVVSTAAAQETASEDPTTTPGSRPAVSERLFISFIEDSALADRQWWEGRLEVADGDVVDSTLVRGVVAVQPWNDVELGGRFGFGSTDTPRGLPDGSGGTDLDLWGKFMIGTDARGTSYTVGGTLTVPTGDNTSGLGVDAWGISLFGAARHALQSVTVGGHIGVQFNGDGETLGLPSRDGEPSAMLGGMVIFPVARSLNLIGELDYRSERLDGYDTDARLLGGLNWRVSRRGTVRGAVALGLADGAPDGQLLLGYAAEF
jgi:hypothetical protein